MYLSQDELCKMFLSDDQITAIKAERLRSEFRFRPVRGGLNDSLKHQVSFYDLYDLYRYVACCICDPPLDVSQIYTKKYSDRDDRIGWSNIHIVMKKTSDGSFPVGYVSFKPCTFFGTLFSDYVFDDDDVD